jgi:surface carbohydrate biosynthesis protein
MSRAVYFHIDEVARDAVVAANLRQTLKAHGVELVYGNRATTEFFPWSDDFSAFDLCVFPNLDLFQSICRHPDRLNTPIVILPTETVGGTSRNLDRVAAKYFGSFSEECWAWSNKISAFCVWGPSHVKAFEAKGPQLLEKVHVVGHPRFDRRCQIRGTMANRGPKIRVGIISRFVAINPFDRRSTLQVVYEGRKIPGHELPIFRLSPTLDVEDRVYTEIIDLRHVFEILDKLDPERHEVVLRGHPRENRTTWETLIARNGIRVKMAPWDEPYMHWLHTLDYVVGPVSTSFYDCMVVGKKPICTIDIEPKRQSHILAGGDDENLILNHVVRPKSIEELVRMVSEKPSSEPMDLPPDLVDLLHQESNYPDCATSIDRIARVCLNVLQTTAHQRSPRGVARWKYELFAAGQAQIGHIRDYNKPEQSALFTLDRRRKRWIDALASGD